MQQLWVATISYSAWQRPGRAGGFRGTSGALSTLKARSSGMWGGGRADGSQQLGTWCSLLGRLASKTQHHLLPQSWFPLCTSGETWSQRPIVFKSLWEAKLETPVLLIFVSKQHFLSTNHLSISQAVKVWELKNIYSPIIHKLKKHRGFFKHHTDYLAEKYKFQDCNTAGLA